MADNPTKVGPERRSEAPDAVPTAGSATAAANATAINAILGVLRNAGFLQD
jgi:hypothetical protein